MSEYRKLVEEFFLLYEKPVVDELVVGLSGIDPPLKRGAGGINHEELSGLLGGSAEDGHYHLTAEEWEAVRRILDTLMEIGYDGGNASTSELDYEATRAFWLDGGYAVPEQDGNEDGGYAQG